MATWMDDLARDLRYAARLLRRAPAFALTAGLSVAIGIGANTTIFTVANALLFRPPAGVAMPDRLVDIGRSRGGAGFSPSSYPNYLDVRQRATTLDGVYAFPLFPQALSFGAPGDAGRTERVYGTFVTANYFRVLGAMPAAGRLFDTADVERPAATPIVVLSYDFWTRRFTRDPAVVGRALTINRTVFTVAGVAAAGFHGTGVRGGDLWAPIEMLPLATRDGGGLLTNRAAAWLLVGARLKAGVTIEQAAAEVDAVGSLLAREYPDQNRGTGLRVLAASPVPDNGGVIGAFLGFLMGLVTIVLAIACANLTGVLLARAVARRREIAVRLALGAGRARLARQLLAETILLFALGAAFGLVFARVMTSLLVSRLPALPFPIDVSLALDVRAVLFTGGLALVAALVSGFAPARQASKTDVVSTLKDDGPMPGRLRLRHAFLIGQVALSIVLVVVAGLFARALRGMASVDPGFDARGVEIAALDLSLGGYDETTGPIFAHDLVERVRAIPGVQAATIAAVLPGGFERIGLGGLGAPGFTSANGERFASADWNIVEPGYFATIRMPLVAGHDFTAADRKGAPLVTIVGEGVAKRFWPGGDPIGKSIVHARGGVERTLTVVGVARDPKYGSLVDGNSGLYVYLPLQQEYLAGWTMIVARAADRRSRMDEIRGVVASMDPTLPIVTTQTGEDYTSLGLLPQRIAVSVAGSLGLVGLLLAAIGIYGVTAYLVAGRTREIGIRVALGARRADVVRMILREGMSLALIGSAIGLVMAAGAARLLASLLFGIRPLDPATFSIAAALFIAVSLVACAVPARRATGISALDALRSE